MGTVRDHACSSLAEGAYGHLRYVPYRNAVFASVFIVHCCDTHNFSAVADETKTKAMKWLWRA